MPLNYIPLLLTRATQAMKEEVAEDAIKGFTV